MIKFIVKNHYITWTHAPEVCKLKIILNKLDFFFPKFNFLSEFCWYCFLISHKAVISLIFSHTKAKIF